MQTPEEFTEAWIERLSSGAQVLFRSGAPDPETLIHTAIADAFVRSVGLTPIGFNWELLDAAAPEHEPRSARAEIARALTHDIANPSQNWLDPDLARRCADAFLDLFDPATCTIVSNRYDGLWNPIAGREVEWGFVGFDGQRAALLLMTN